MSQKNCKSMVGLVFLIFLLVVSGCAGRNYLLVDYQIPATSPQLKGQIVRLEVVDQRASQAIMTPAAAYQFPEFSGIYSLAWVLPDHERVLAGEHHLEPLFKTTLEKRLAEHGIGLTDDIHAEAPVLKITLKQFDLDLQDRKWKARMAYEAVLGMEGHPTAREAVQGSAERVQILGRKGADLVVSEIFSDGINRLDIQKLFKNADLIQ